MSNRRRSFSRSSNGVKPATITQVASRAGVSTATISRVLSGVGGVSPELEQRVREAVAELDYQPNRLARNLRRQATQIVGLVIPDIQNPFFTSLLRGIENVLEQSGYTLLLSNTDEDERRERAHLATLRAEGVAGIILTPTHNDPEKYRIYVDGGMPLVLIDRSIPGANLDTVTVNNIQGAFDAVNHLVKLGHTLIGLVGGPDRVSTAYERKMGYLKALQDAGISPRQDFIQEGNMRQEGGREAMQRLLELPQPPSAVLVANNLMTLGALQAIHQRNISVPGTISIVGFDDMDWAASLQPPLTAIMQPTYELGSAAAQLLIERMQKPDRPARQVILQTRLILRDSTGPVAAQANTP